MRHELKAKPLAKGGHLRHRHHLASAAAQHNRVHVVDHHAGRSAAHIAQSIRQKYLAIEALECWVALEEQHARVAQHRRGGLHLAFLAGQFQRVRRRVMLEFRAGRKLILSRRYGRLVPDAVTPAERRQCGIRQRCATRQQFLMDSHEIPLALVEKLQDLLAVGFGFLRTLQLRHGGGVRPQNSSHRYTGNPQHPRDLPFRYSLAVQLQNRGALCLAQHVVFALEEVFRRCAEVAFQSVPSAAALRRVAVDSAPMPLGRQAADGHG
ncbi:MAG TPA: hypothetical protein VKX49_03745 [Bryobacteraceae bacterium]|nr:hypothetical protein [Bryobacteraceae bacterium]